MYSRFIVFAVYWTFSAYYWCKYHLSTL